MPLNFLNKPSTHVDKGFRASISSSIPGTGTHEQLRANTPDSVRNDALASAAPAQTERNERP
eukprot:5609051-Alexandrium_andersonii.AAC.1